MAAGQYTAVAEAVEYRLVVGFPGYRVGTDGSIWSRLVHDRLGTRIGSKWKVMKPHTYKMRGRGYPKVRLWSEGQRFRRHVHRLVLEAFVGPCPDGQECLHGNHNGNDCRLSNLRWGTHEENMDDSAKAGRMPRGHKQPNAKLIESEVSEIRLLYRSGFRCCDLARLFGVNPSAIERIIHGRGWKHVP